jgi:hypothetical protein
MATAARVLVVRASAMTRGGVKSETENGRGIGAIADAASDACACLKNQATSSLTVL